MVSTARSAYGSRPWAEQLQQQLDQPLQGSHGIQQGSHQDAEADEQADLGHDVAEAFRDRPDRVLEPEPCCQAEVDRAEHQRDDRIDVDNDDQKDDREDRDSGVQGFHAGSTLRAARAVREVPRPYLSVQGMSTIETNRVLAMGCRWRITGSAPADGRSRRPRLPC